MNKLKILNLYAGIGGNRKLWTDVNVTAVESDEIRAAAYAKLFPDDTVIVGDAHQYLLDHYKEFDFIWSSPPCPTHSRIRNIAGVGSGKYPAVYPDMGLYQEIILLEKHFRGLYCVENVVPYYKPLIPGQKIARHFFWANFHIAPYKLKRSVSHQESAIKNMCEYLGMWPDLTGLSAYKKRQTLRNCVHPQLGLHVLNCGQPTVSQPERSLATLSVKGEKQNGERTNCQSL